MELRTIAKGSAFLKKGATCRQCHCVFRIGEQVASHNLGKDAPVDIRVVAFHANCLHSVLGRAPKPRFPSVKEIQALKAEEFRAHRDRIAAGGPVFLPDEPTPPPAQDGNPHLPSAWEWPDEAVHRLWIDVWSSAIPARNALRLTRLT